jgi:hypothetical protein
VHQKPVALLPAPSRTGTPLSEDSPQFRTRLTEVLSTWQPLLRHLPKGAEDVWSQALSRCLSRLCGENPLWEDLLYLCLFTKVNLVAPKRGGRKHKKTNLTDIRGRVEQFSTGQGWAMCLYLPRSARPRREQTGPILSHFEKAARLQEPQFRDALRALLDEGALSKALKLILWMAYAPPLIHKSWRK